MGQTGASIETVLVEFPAVINLVVTVESFVSLSTVTAVLVGGGGVVPVHTAPSDLTRLVSAGLDLLLRAVVTACEESAIC